MNERIKTAKEWAAVTEDSIREDLIQHKTVPLDEPESKFEAGIQDIIGRLIDAEGLIWQRGDLRQVIELLIDARSRLVALANEERGREEIK